MHWINTVLYSQDPNFEAAVQELHEKIVLKEAGKIGVPQREEKIEPKKEIEKEQKKDPMLKDFIQMTVEQGIKLEVS